MRTAKTLIRLGGCGSHNYRVMFVFRGQLLFIIYFYPMDICRLFADFHRIVGLVILKIGYLFIRKPPLTYKIVHARLHAQTQKHAHYTHARTHIHTYTCICYLPKKTTVYIDCKRNRKYQGVTQSQATANL